MLPSTDGCAVMHLQCSHPAAITQHIMHCTPQDMHTCGNAATSDAAALSQYSLADAMCNQHQVSVKCNIMPCATQQMNNDSVRQLSANCSAGQTHRHVCLCYTPHGNHLCEATRLKDRGHQEHIAASIDQVTQRLIIGKPQPGPVGVLPAQITG